MNWSKTAILVDFDGTITTEDTNDKLVGIHWNKNIEEYWNDFRNGKINLLELIELQFKEIKLTEEEYTEFILDEFELTNGFEKFYRNVRKYNITLAIVSGGFKNGIDVFLEKHGIKDIKVYANSFIFDEDNISVDFYDKKGLDCCNNGPCGNCKIRHYKNYKSRYEQVIFIGDGFTDKWVAEIADMVFAKDSLLEYCKEKGIDCIRWDDFNDINKILFMERGK